MLIHSFFIVDHSPCAWSWAGTKAQVLAMIPAKRGLPFFAILSETAPSLFLAQINDPFIPPGPEDEWPYSGFQFMVIFFGNQPVLGLHFNLPMYFLVNLLKWCGKWMISPKTLQTARQGSRTHWLPWVWEQGEGCSSVNAITLFVFLDFAFSWSVCIFNKTKWNFWFTLAKETFTEPQWHLRGGWIKLCCDWDFRIWFNAGLLSVAFD